MANTNQMPKLKIYPDITNERHHAAAVECVTDQQKCMQNLNYEFYFNVQIRIVTV